MSSPSSKQPLLLFALDGMLRPIARFCLKRGLHIQDLLEACKRTLVQVATEELGEEKNIARLSAATGLQRRDVSRLMLEEGEVAEPSGLVNRLIGQWRHDKRFLDSKGQPKELLLNTAGKDSFLTLVQTLTHDIPAGSLLFELERLGAIKKFEDSIRLLAPAYIPKENSREGFRMLGRDIGYLLQGVTENIERRSEIPNLHATVEFDNIRQDKLAAIRLWLLDEGSKFQEKVSKHLAAQDLDIAPSKSPTPGGKKVCFSVFSWTQEDDSDE